jgi:hypothetical protein
LTLDEAIKYLTESTATGVLHEWDKETEAKRLGIEALKRVQWSRKYEVKFISYSLPGETVDK